MTRTVADMRVVTAPRSSDGEGEGESEGQGEGED